MPWRFETVRGRVRDFGLKPAGGATFTILAHASTHRLHYPQLRAARRILLLASWTRQQTRALEMLLARSQRERIELTLVTVAGKHADRREILRWLQRYDGRVTLLEISASELLVRLARPGAGYDCALLSHDYAGENMQLLLKSLNCPIILSA